MSEKNVVEKIDDMVPIKTVLISVSDKTGLDTLIPGMLEIYPYLWILSTGGTYTHIRKIIGETKQLMQVSEYTSQPETQGGLVKTLDFKIYLGLLTETYNDAHQEDLKRTGALAIDMVICNLYPFGHTIKKDGCTIEDARGNIDIGGPTMIRASAKNFIRVASVVDPLTYPVILEKLREYDGALSLGDRFDLAKIAFNHTADYDWAISRFLDSRFADNVNKFYKKGE